MLAQVMGAVLAATPVSAPSSQGVESEAGVLLAPGRIRALDARERFNDSLEAFFDKQVCAGVKAGLRTGIPDVSALVHTHSCSMRALELFPADGGQGARARLLWEVEGWERDGARVAVRGEAQAKLSRAGRSWTFDAFEPLYTERTARAVPAFRELRAEELGLHAAPADEARERGGYELMRGGLAVFDLDGDGLLDLLVTGDEQARLYRNLGAFKFEALPLKLPKVVGTPLSVPAVGDFDNDGDPDVLITWASVKKARAVMLRNDGGKLVQAGFVPTDGWVTGAVPWDFDRDGTLDLVLIRYGARVLGPNDMLEADDGAPPVFLRGKGDLTFEEVVVPKDLVRGRWGLAGVAADLGGRGSASLYIANDYGSNDLWSWRDGALVEGADALDLRDPGNGMSADVGDVNADGKLDLYVANMFSKAGTRILNAVAMEDALGEKLRKFGAGNTLYLTRADGTFEEVSKEVGVNRGLWAFASVFVDYDNDARLDLAVANGFLSAPDRKDL